MSKKTKSILRKGIYALIFIAMIGSFIYLGDKYASNSKEKEITIKDYYKDIEDKQYEVIRGTKMISLLKKGKHLILIGNKESEYSKEYVKQINEVVKELNIEKIYYYDIINDKAQTNSNYYKIIELLDGYLTTTDTNKNNLLAPSFYIIDNGKVKYYNTDTSAMKNTDTVEAYWTLKKEFDFKEEIKANINKYYLNK